jgi:hypothetical protein
MGAYPGLRLIHKSQIIDLQDGISGGRYLLASTFSPPKIAIDPLILKGTAGSPKYSYRLLGVTADTRSWVIPLHIKTSSESELKRAVQDIQNMLTKAGDEVNPLYAEFRTNAIIPGPPFMTYGLAGNAIYYEILSGEIIYSDNYTQANMVAYDDEIKLQLLIAPMARGPVTDTFYSNGAAFLDTIGRNTNNPRGVVILPASNIYSKNPNFFKGDGLSWVPKYTALNPTMFDSSYNTDPIFIFLGVCSLKMIPNPGAALPGGYYQNVGNGLTNKFGAQIMAKAADGGALTASDITLVQDGTPVTSPTIRAFENGWYQISASLTANGTATNNIGFVIPVGNNGRTVYIGHFQVEYQAVDKGALNVSQPFNCDIPGGTWSAATSATRRMFNAGSTGAGKLWLPKAGKYIQPGKGTIRIGWTPFYSSAELGTGGFILLNLYDTTNRIILGYDASNTRFYVQFSGVNVNSSTVTFSYGESMLFHIVWDRSGFSLYLNGSSIASTTTPPGSFLIGSDDATRIYIGSAAGATNHSAGRITAFATWLTKLTAPQIASDYVELAPLLADGQQADIFPILSFLHATTNLGSIYNTRDTATNTDAFTVFGIPGSDPAPINMITDWTHSTSLSNQAIYLSRLSTAEHVDWAKFLLFDLNVLTDTACLGDGYNSAGVSAGGNNSFSSNALGCFTPDTLQYLAGKELMAWARMQDLGTGQLDMQFQIMLTYTGSIACISDFYPLFTMSNWTGRVTLTAKLPEYQSPLVRELANSSYSQCRITIKRASTGTTGNVYMDYFRMLVEPITKITFPTLESTQYARLYLDTEKRWNFITDALDEFLSDEVTITGKDLELEPGKYNHFIHTIGNEDSNISWTINEKWSFVRFSIIPMYRLL